MKKDKKPESANIADKSLLFLPKIPVLMFSEPTDSWAQLFVIGLKQKYEQSDEFDVEIVPICLPKLLGDDVEELTKVYNLEPGPDHPMILYVFLSGESIGRDTEVVEFLEEFWDCRLCSASDSNRTSFYNVLHFEILPQGEPIHHQLRRRVV